MTVTAETGVVTMEVKLGFELVSPVVIDAVLTRSVPDA